MTKLQYLFVTLVDSDIFQFIHCDLSEKFVLQHCEHIFVYVDMQSVYRCMQCLHHLN